jgi:cytochrome P450
MCIGNTFALTELQLTLATIAQRYRLLLEPGYSSKPETLLTVRPQGGLRVRLSP